MVAINEYPDGIPQELLDHLQSGILPVDYVEELLDVIEELNAQYPTTTPDKIKAFVSACEGLDCKYL